MGIDSRQKTMRQLLDFFFRDFFQIPEIFEQI